MYTMLPTVLTTPMSHLRLLFCHLDNFFAVHLLQIVYTVCDITLGVRAPGARATFADYVLRLGGVLRLGIAVSDIRRFTISPEPICISARGGGRGASDDIFTPPGWAICGCRGPGPRAHRDPPA
ncbi:hypothetical protein EVAR_44386_1 [Eumeta japonica]|uniref:Uncharacterized protein n=1 Tax=Eumeta variegata TaxID=151549 RepID=A0A4C1X5S7_EUMVA|nr:hypothetical protein EVAR_44386_1 [Eumeta japonica]